MRFIPHLLWLLVVLGLLVSLRHYRNKATANTFVVQRIGGFYGNAVSVPLDERLYVPTDYETICLGLSVSDSSHRPPDSDVFAVAKSITSLRLELKLFEGDSSNALWKGEVSLGTNCSYFPVWKPDLGMLFHGLEPFPASDRQSSNGMLIPGARYRIRLEILNPTTGTNRLSLWLYTISGPIVNDDDNAA